MWSVDLRRHVDDVVDKSVQLLVLIVILKHHQFRHFCGHLRYFFFAKILFHIFQRPFFTCLSSIFYQFLNLSRTTAIVSLYT